MKQKLSLSAVGALLAATGCVNSSGSIDRSCSPITVQNTQSSPDWGGTVFTIVMENHSYDDIVGSSDAPFINSLIRQNAVAAGYRDNGVHPSEPNYIELVSGENFGILDDADPISHHLAATSHLVDQIEMQGLTWRAYMESMGQPCGLIGHYPYEAKHDPFVYFNDVNGWDGTRFQTSQRCNDHIVDYSQLDVDLASGTLSKYVWITPNMLDDMHDGTTQAGDAWLAREVPKILSSPQFNEGGVLFITWDEGSGVTAGDDPPMIVVSPHARPGFVSKTAFNESSYLKTVEKILGLQSLPCSSGPAAAAVSSMDELFDVPLDSMSASNSTSS